MRRRFSGPPVLPPPRRRRLGARASSTCLTWLTLSLATNRPTDTQYRPENPQAGGEEGGAAAAGSGSPSTTAGITRSLRMTLQEAQLILNVKEGETPEKLREVSRSPLLLLHLLCDKLLMLLSCRFDSATTSSLRPTRRPRSTPTLRRRRR